MEEMYRDMRIEHNARAESEKKRARVREQDGIACPMPVSAAHDGYVHHKLVKSVGAEMASIGKGMADAMMLDT